MTASNIVT